MNICNRFKYLAYAKFGSFFKIAIDFFNNLNVKKHHAHLLLIE